MIYNKPRDFVFKAPAPEKEKKPKKQKVKKESSITEVIVIKQKPKREEIIKTTEGFPAAGSEYIIYYFDEEKILVNGKLAKPSLKVFNGDTISILERDDQIIDLEKEETYEDRVKNALLDITVESENEILLSNIQDIIKEQL